MSDLFQSVPFAVVLLIIGFVFLVKGADAFVEGCSSIARRYHVPSLIIGMTIVAMGTSLPETAVSVTAAVTGNNALAVSNAVGSNIFNLMVVVGACTLFTSVAVQINTLKIDFPISILCAVLLLILGAAGMSLGHIDGVVFIPSLFGIILYPPFSYTPTAEFVVPKSTPMQALLLVVLLIFLFLPLSEFYFLYLFFIIGLKSKPIMMVF